MKNREHVRRPVVLLVAALMIAGLAGTALAADPPVSVTFAVSGDAVPGATVSAKATIKINDGSTLQSVAWSQISGVPVTLANSTGETVTVTLPSRKVYREHLIEVLEEKPVADAQLPAYIPAKAHYESGLQNRFGVVGVVPHAEIDAAAVKFNVKVTIQRSRDPRLQRSVGTVDRNAERAPPAPRPPARQDAGDLRLEADEAGDLRRDAPRCGDAEPRVHA